MTKYVLGFLFNPAGTSVWLVHKQKHALPGQLHKFNGLGGKVESGETAGQAMRRECKEEAGLEIDSWFWFCVMHGSERDGEWVVECFVGYTDQIPHPMGDEDPCFSFDVNDLPLACLPTVRWLVPMALTMARGETEGIFRVEKYL